MKKLLILLVLVLPTVLFLSCKNPLFSIGLGDKVDLEPPELDLTSHANGAYVKGLVTLQGTFADDLDEVSVEVSFNGGVTFLSATVNKVALTWGVTVDTTTPSYPDGESDIIVRATDKSGKAIEKRLLLYIDNTPPLVLINVPLGYIADEYNGDIDIKGDAVDPFPIDRVEIEVLNSVGATVLSGQPAQGSNSWSYVFASETYVSGIEDYSFIITAYDRAGNYNSAFYHTYDVANDLNGGIPVAAEDLYIIDNGGTVVGLEHITEPLLDTITLFELPLTINQSLDLPVFDVYNPDPNAIPPDTLAAGAKAIGMVTDDEEGMNVGSIEIQFDGGAWNPVDTTVGTGLAVRWEHSLSGLSEGLHSLRLRAQDTLGAEGYSNSVDFTIDAGAPTVEITSPVQGAYLNTADFTVSGTANDGGTVSSIEVSLDDGVTYNPATSTSGDYDTWEFDVVGASEGILLLKAKATDDSTKVAYYNMQVIVDTTFPTAAFTSPTKATSVNGPVTVRGISEDPSGGAVTKVEIQIGELVNWITLPDLYNWEYLFDSAGYANATYATESPPASNIWKINIYARITDIAGNITTTAVDDYYIFIDQELDKPTVNIISPPSGTTSVAGPLLISGTALDDDGLYRIEMQIDVNGDGDFSDQIDFWDGISSTPDGLPDDAFEDETAWYVADGTSLWSQEINSFGEMYNVGGGGGYITVRVRAVDTKDGGVTPGIEGDIKEFSIQLDDTIPRIQSLNHSSGGYVQGIFNITGEALDDTQIDNLLISYDGGINYQNLVSGIDYTINAVNDYDLDIQIDTTPGDLNISSGILYLRLKIVDDANNQSITTLNLNVDNVYPSDAPSGYTADASDINGASARVQGTGQDAGTVSGVEKIEVYFVDSSDDVYNPGTGATTAVGIMDFGDGSGAVDYPTGAGSDNYKIIIDDINEFGNDSGGNGDGDGFDESLTLAGSTYNWWAEFDSNMLPDGQLEIHYVIFDNSGNATHYELSGFIKNNKPNIDSVTVGSDVDDSDTVEGDEQFVYSGSFTARNRLYIDISASDDQLPGTPLSYEVIHDPSGTPTTVLTAASGTIDISSGYSDGATQFLCRITDQTGIIDEELLDVTIENNDTAPPTIIVDPLTQSHLVNGHLEEDGESLHDGTDPDVSGEIKFTGTTGDNQRIESITVTITNFDAGSGEGLEHTVASWSVDTLATSDGNFVIDTQNLDESAGHQVTWTYTWDSTGIAEVTGNNISIQFKAYDFNPNSDTDTDVVDVVPYITDIVRTLNTHRSKYRTRDKRVKTGNSYEALKDNFSGNNSVSCAIEVANSQSSLSASFPLPLIF